MTFALTLLYIALTYLSPAEILPVLAPYRIMLWTAVMVLLGIAFTFLMGRFPVRTPQFWLMSAFISSIAISHLIHLQFGGALNSLFDFMTSGIAFFAIVATARSTRQLRILILVLVLTGAGLLTRSLVAYCSGEDTNLYVLREAVRDPNTGLPTEILSRIRSVGVLSDPNDFAQFLLVLLPFVFLLWRPRRSLRNICFVLVPAAYLITGVLMTQSRGAMLGLVALFVFSLAKRLPRPAQLAVAAMGLALVVVLNHGQRALSTSESSAAGRIDAWGVGIAMLESDPFFGTGYNTFLNYNDLTAHNSFVLCFAELGLVGYFIWLGLIISTCMQLHVVGEDDSPADDSVAGLANAVRLALLTFLVTSWFLSRTYIVTLYIVLGIATSLIVLASRTSDENDAYPQVRWPQVTVFSAIASLMAVYGFIRLKSL
ncbi:MAG: O-antigen ligase family protein [Bryobacteraceae bacterium]